MGILEYKKHLVKVAFIIKPLPYRANVEKENIENLTGTEFFLHSNFKEQAFEVKFRE